MLKITPPGSKSIANRYLILAALKKEKTTIKNIPDCDDTKYLIAALRKIKTHSPTKPLHLFTGNAGTTTRFLTAFATLLGRKIIISGDKNMQTRPIGELASALNKLEADISTKNGFPPITINPQKLLGGKIKINGNISSQYLSALLMTCPFAKKDTIIEIEQELCSRSYIKMTINTLKQFGIKIENKNFTQFKIKGNQKISLKKPLIVESDVSSASYLGAYIALHPNTQLLIKNIFLSSIQGDIKFLDYLQKQGCKIESKKEGVIIKSPRKLKPLRTVDMNQTPDLVMTFAVLAMFCSGKTRIHNIANLKIKETDRLQALKNEITKFGIPVKIGEDYIEIKGDPKLINSMKNNKIEIETYSDHRIAMAFGIIKDLIPKITIKNPKCVSKSYPNFWNDLKKLQHGNRRTK